jgi:hypothetical protein
MSTSQRGAFSSHLRLKQGDIVCSPKHLGSLGVKNLRLLNLDLRLHWLWLEKGKPWLGLDFRSLPQAKELFKEATYCTLGDGNILKFWMDHWLDTTSISESAPNLWSFIKAAKKGTLWPPLYLTTVGLYPSMVFLW